MDSSFARFRSRALVLTGMGTPGRILDEHVDEVGAGDHADDLVLFDDGNQPLVRAHDDLHEALEEGRSGGTVRMVRCMYSETGMSPSSWAIALEAVWHSI